MKQKKLLVLAFALLSFNEAFSCDVCNLFSNVFLNENYSRVGLVYRSRYMYGTMGQLHHGLTTKHSSNQEVTNYYDQVVKDIFNVLEVRAQFNIGERWRVSAYFPLVNNYRSIEGYTITDIYNVSDPLILGQYLLWGTMSGDQKYVHRLTGGLGIKMPVGPRDIYDNNRKVDDDLQPGTGSWDFLATLNYRFKVKKLGMDINQSYRINTQGFKDFKYGNSYNINSTIFYIFNIKDNWAIMPQTGVYLEHASKDRDANGKFEHSGGHSIYHNSGLTVQWKKFQFAFQYQYRFYHKLNGIQIPTKNRLIASIYYQFSLKK